MNEPTSEREGGAAAAKASPSRRPRVRRLLQGAALAASFAAGAVVFSSPGALAMQAAEAHGGMAMHGDLHARIHAHVARMLAEADATPEQRAKIHDILKTAFQSVGTVHHRLGDSHQELHRLLTAPTVDRAALERLRAQDMTELDQASRTLVQALADAAEVLTPEQRARLASVEGAHHPRLAQPRG